MPCRSYTYSPANIAEGGKDKMRFELGDTMVEGGAQTAALSDQEITAVLALYPGKWKRAKLALLETIFRRFAYEVDTKVGPLSLALQSRAKMWKEMYDDLKESMVGYSVPTANPAAISGDPYFYAGMMDNPDTVPGKGRDDGLP